VIPTIPDILSTWGIYQIVENVERFSKSTGRSIPALGIVATKVQGNNLHRRIMDDLKAQRLGRFSDQGALQQPPLFNCSIPQTVAVARGADAEADIRTFKGKYAAAYDSFRGLTREIITACENQKPS
jgi:chromosome partitioning protein